MAFPLWFSLRQSANTLNYSWDDCSLAIENSLHPNSYLQAYGYWHLFYCPWTLSVLLISRDQGGKTSYCFHELIWTHKSNSYWLGLGWRWRFLLVRRFTVRWLRLIWDSSGLLATTTTAPVPSALGPVPAVIVAGRDPVAMEVTVPDELTRGNAFCFWVADYRWRGGYAHRIARAEEEIRSIARREDIRQSRPVNRSSTTSGNQEIEVNLNRDYWFKRKTEWAYDQCSFPYWLKEPRRTIKDRLPLRRIHHLHSIDKPSFRLLARLPEVISGLKAVGDEEEAFCFKP